MNWTSRSGRDWALRTVADGTVTELAEELDLLPTSARVFAARGHSRGSMGAFLNPSLSHLHDPGLLHGAEAAIARIEAALSAAERIRLVTDYDVDGTTSCLILHAALDRRIAQRQSGAEISYHIPDRFTEGYGLSIQAVERAATEGVRLLITADIGVRDHVSVRRARELGVDVLICDHHLPPGEDVPADAIAVVCPPQRGCAYPNKALAACGVSLKLASALLADDPRRDEVLSSMLKLAAIGTVADVVDLSTAENRAIVTLGIRAMNQGKNSPGLGALLQVSGIRPGTVSTSDLGFRLGPRINAAGRLKDANAVVRLIRERDQQRALDLASLLDSLNRQRQGIQEHLVKIVLAQVADAGPLAEFVVAAGPETEGWHRGVVGIAASKVRDQLHRPVAVVSVLGNSATGSIRSVPKVHAVKALDAAADLLLRYGGHAAAAGFSLESRHLPALAERLADFVRTHHEDAACREREEVDAWSDAARVPVRLADELAAMEPCGKGNPVARLAFAGKPERPRIIKDKHLFFRCGSLEAVWWGEAARRAELEGVTTVFGSLSRDDWDGRAQVKLVVEDVA